MNIYDTANKLAHEMRESEEYKNYKALKDSIGANEESVYRLKLLEALLNGE